MLEAAKEARTHAYAPYSHFHVGACIKTSLGNLYSGCNIENAAYGLTLCAEGSAIAAMVTAGEKKITEMYVISSGDEICPPCGACRQRILEFSTPNTLIHMYSNNAKKELIMTIDQLLPHSFNISHLEK
jgi:cytidine deaminase